MENEGTRVRNLPALRATQAGFPPEPFPVRSGPARYVVWGGRSAMTALTRFGPPRPRLPWSPYPVIQFRSVAFT